MKREYIMIEADAVEIKGVSSNAKANGTTITVQLFVTDPWVLSKLMEDFAQVLRQQGDKAKPGSRK